MLKGFNGSKLGTNCGKMILHGVECGPLSPDHVIFSVSVAEGILVVVRRPGFQPRPFPRGPCHGRAPPPRSCRSLPGAFSSRFARRGAIGCRRLGRGRAPTCAVVPAQPIGAPGFPSRGTFGENERLENQMFTNSFFLRGKSDLGRFFLGCGKKMELPHTGSFRIFFPRAQSFGVPIFPHYIFQRSSEQI